MHSAYQSFIKHLHLPHAHLVSSVHTQGWGQGTRLVHTGNQQLLKLLVLSEVNTQQVEHDYPIDQREDGSFPSINRGEQAYQALRWLTESKGHLW